MEYRFRHKQQTKQFQNVSSQTCLRSHLSIFYHIILKMLGLYLYTLIIGHKSCNMLRILNKLTLQKEWQKDVTKNVFLTKVKTQQQQRQQQQQ